MHKTLQLLTSAALTGALVFSAGGLAAAQEANASLPAIPAIVSVATLEGGALVDLDQPQLKILTSRKADGGNILFVRTTAPSASLAELVTKGVISQATLDKINAFFEEQHAQQQAEREKLQSLSADELKAFFAEQKNRLGHEKQDRFADLVSAGVITAAEAELIQSELAALQTAAHQTRVREQVNSLVAENLISAETAQKMETFLLNQATERKAEMDKLKNLSADERKLALENNKPQLSTSVSLNPYSEMVTAGILTQSEADAIMAAQQAKMNAARQQSLTAYYQQLVDKGVIEQATAERIITYQMSQTSEKAHLGFMVTREVPAEFSPALQPGDRPQKVRVPGSKNAEQGTDPTAAPARVQSIYADMVKAGVITENEAKAIKEYTQQQIAQLKPGEAGNSGDRFRIFKAQ